MTPSRLGSCHRSQTSTRAAGNLAPCRCERPYLVRPHPPSLLRRIRPEQQRRERQFPGGTDVARARSSKSTPTLPPGRTPGASRCPSRLRTARHSPANAKRHPWRTRPSGKPPRETCDEQPKPRLSRIVTRDLAPNPSRARIGTLAAQPRRSDPHASAKRRPLPHASLRGPQVALAAHRLTLRRI